MAVLADVGPLGHTATPSQDCGRISDCFVVIFRKRQKLRKGGPVLGLALGKIFLKGISQFGKTVSLAIARFVFNFSPRSLFIKSERKKYFLKFPPEIFGSLGFVLCREQCRPRLARRASAPRKCRCPLSLPLLSKDPLSWVGSRHRLEGRRPLETCFPGLGRARRNSPVSRGKVSSLSFSSSCGGPEVAASRPPPAPPPRPLRLLPLSRVGTHRRLAPRLLFRVRISLQPSSIPVCAAGQRARAGPKAPSNSIP